MTAYIRSSDIKWLDMATALAEQAPHEKWRVGAILVRSGRVIGMGVNKYRNDPSKVDIDGVSYHAEDVAVRRAGDARNATIYVARVTKSGYIGLAKPCERCTYKLASYGIHTAIWTEPGGWGKERIRNLASAAAF